MISRRTLLASWLGASLFGTGSAALAAAWARKPKVLVAPAPTYGPRTLARQEWPPAITPEYVGIVDKGYACFADDMGRLAIVDLKRDDNPQVMGELFGMGRKVVALSISQHRAFAVVQVESGAETIFQLVIAGLTPANDISIMSRSPLSNFTDPSCISAFGDVLAIGGTGLNGENQVVFYVIGKKKVEPQAVSALTVERNPYKLDLQDKLLLVLCGAESSELIAINVANPRAPEATKALRLDGSYPALARFKDQIVIAGYGSDRNFRVGMVTLRPTPIVSTSVILPAVTEILDVAAQKGQFLILANQGSRQTVVPINVAKKPALSLGNPILLPGGSRGSSPRAHIAVKDRDAYIATDWGGVQVLNVTKDGWQFSYSHTIPRLPASSIVLDANNAVLACAEFKAYDIKDPRHPTLIESIQIPASIKSMLKLGRTFLCLSRDNLSIRSLNKPSEQIAQAKTSGTALAYDSSISTAYVIANSERGSVLSKFKATEDSIKATGSVQMPVSARKALAQSGRVLLAGLNELNLFQMDDNPQLIGSRKMPNLAIRDVVMPGGDMIYLSCVDENLKGSLLALSAAKQDLGIIGACDLPVDATALAVSAGKAVVIGRSKTGKDMVSLVNVSDPVQMKVIETLPTIEAASAVSIQGKTAAIAGRGIELLDIS